MDCNFQYAIKKPFFHDAQSREPKTRLSVFENRTLRMISEPKREEVIVEWRKLHNEELSDLYFSQNIIRAKR